MHLKPIKMIFKLKKLILLFIFLLIFYAIYFLVLNTAFLKINEFKYEPINYRNFGQMNRLKKQYEMLNKIKNEKIVLSKLKSNKLYKNIDCAINDEYNVNCLKSVLSQEVYLPFNSFIKNYFDVYGKLGRNVLDSKEVETFYFDHSYSKVYPPSDKYDFRRKFLWFENYNVDQRDRVKYISGLYNVPISNQWKSKSENGHYYPVQIGQFGLSHFNKFLLFGEPKFIYLNTNKYIKKIDLRPNDNDIDLKNDDLKDIDSTNLTGYNLDPLNSLNNTESTDLNQTIIIRNLRKRKVSKNEDDLNEMAEFVEPNEQVNSNDQSNEEQSNLNEIDNEVKNRTIFLNDTNLVLQMNFTKKSSFFNSLFVSFKFKLVRNLKIVFTLINDKRSKFKVIYKSINNDVFKNDNLIYGVGNQSDEWRLFTRNVGIDLIKSVNLSKRKNFFDLKVKNLHLFSIAFSGRAYLNEIKLSSNGHFYHFVNSVNWFLKFQDENGGWKSKVNKRLASSSLNLNKNWYSSMAQGHAISLLVRMFHFIDEFKLVERENHELNRQRNGTTNHEHTKNLIKDELTELRNNLNDTSIYSDADNLILKNSLVYLNIAIDAVDLFKKNVSENGILTYFMDQYPFYEEYPTTPSLFVLNGFIYSLFGLYDLKETIYLLVRNQKLEPQLNDYYLSRFDDINQLFDDGIRSLKKLLPFFDTGSSSLYNLQHFTLNLPPIIARWQYHTTHINQLLHLNTILNDKNIDDLAVRWRGYLKGRKVAHN